MDTFWQVFLGALGGGGVLVALLAFFGKALFQQLLAKDLETFRAELARQRERHGVVFSLMHEKRASLIAEVYEHAVALDEEVRNLSALAQSGAELNTSDAGAKFLAMRSAFTRRRLWLSTVLAERVDEFVTVGTDALFSAVFHRSDVSRAGAVATRNLAEVSGKLAYLLKELEAEFRSALGADTS